MKTKNNFLMIIYIIYSVLLIAYVIKTNKYIYLISLLVFLINYKKIIKTNTIKTNKL